MIIAKNLYKKYSYPVNDLEVLFSFFFKKKFKKQLKKNEFYGLENVSFEIKPFENILILGDKKSGKSTLYGIFSSKINFDFGDLKCSRSIFANNFCKFPQNMLPRASLNNYLDVIIAFNNNVDRIYRGVYIKKKIINFFEITKKDLNKNFYDFSIKFHRQIILYITIFTGHKIYMFDNWPFGFDKDKYTKKIINTFFKKKKKNICVFIGNFEISHVEKYISKIIILENGKLRSCKNVKFYDRKVLQKLLQKYNNQTSDSDFMEIEDDE